jgi:hypothetical protein
MGNTRRLVLALVLCWVWIAPASATIALVAGQTASNTSASTGTLSAVMPNNPANGNFVVAAIAVGASGAITSVKDGNGNTFTATTKTPFSGSLGKSGIYYLPNVSTGSKTVTIVTTGSASVQIWVGEFSGVTATTPFENDATANSGANSTSITTPSYTSVNDGDLYISTVEAGGTISAAGGSWSLLSTVQNGNAAEYQVQSAHGALATAFTQSPSAAWSGIVAAFKAAAGGGATCPKTLTTMGVGC